MEEIIKANNESMKKYLKDNPPLNFFHVYNATLEDIQEYLEENPSLRLVTYAELQKVPFAGFYCWCASKNNTTLEDTILMCKRNEDFSFTVLPETLKKKANAHFVKKDTSQNIKLELVEDDIGYYWMLDSGTAGYMYLRSHYYEKTDDALEALKNNEIKWDEATNEYYNEE